MFRYVHILHYFANTFSNHTSNDFLFIFFFKVWAFTKKTVVINSFFICEGCLCFSFPCIIIQLAIQFGDDGNFLSALCRYFIASWFNCYYWEFFINIIIYFHTYLYLLNLSIILLTLSINSDSLNDCLNENGMYNFS